MRLTRNKKTERGQAAIITLGMLVVGLGLSALAIDTGFYYVCQNVLQSAADSASLASAKELYANPSANVLTRQSNARNMAVIYAGKYELDSKAVGLNSASDIQFGFINPATKKYDAGTFSTQSTNPAYSGTGGYNAVRVVARKMSDSMNGTLPTIMARLMGVKTLQTQAVSVAMLDNTVNEVTAGLRPIYGCTNQYDLAAQNAKNNGGSITDTTIRLFGPTFTANGSVVAGCPTSPNGNWGFADFRNNAANSPGNSDISDWFMNGYTGSVVVNNSYKSSQSGSAISSNGVTSALDALIANHTIILVPLIDSFTGSGSNTQVHITSFAGFQITSYKANGSDASRYIEGHFVNTVCAQAQAVCNTGSAPTGGGLVNLRLAY